MNKKFMKLLLIAYGFRKIKIIEERTCEGEFVYDIEALHEKTGEELDIPYVYGIQEFIYHLASFCKEHSIEVDNTNWWGASLKLLLNDEKREEYLDELNEREKQRKEEYDRIKPWEDYMQSIRPCPLYQPDCPDFEPAHYGYGNIALADMYITQCNGNYTMTCPKLREWMAKWDDNELKEKIINEANE